MARRSTQFDSDPATEPLEQRVRRLEDALASLQDTQRLEERIVERLRKRAEPAASPPVEPREQIVAALPPPPPPPLVAVAVPATEPQVNIVEDVGLLLGWLRELRQIGAMLLAWRGGMSWRARVAVVILAAAILFSSWLVPLSQVWGLGVAIDKTICLLFGITLYKILLLESQRYQQRRSH